MKMKFNVQFAVLFFMGIFSMFFRPYPWIDLSAAIYKALAIAIPLALCMGITFGHVITTNKRVNRILWLMVLFEGLALVIVNAGVFDKYLLKLP